MRRSLTRYLIFTSLIWLVIPFPASSQPGRKAEVMVGENALEGYRDGQVVYKTVISFQDQQINMLLMLKKMPDGIIRAALFNEVGISFLNGEVMMNRRKPRVVLNSINPLLDRKIILKKLKRKIAAKATLVIQDPT